MDNAESVSPEPEELVTPEPALSEPSRYFLVMLYPETAMIADADVLAVLREARAISTSKSDSEVHMILNSHGGDIYAAYKVINMLREQYCSRLTVVVPLYAKSAATLMTLGADQIVMAPQSELGPLDLPIEHPFTEGTRISALDGVLPLELLAELARDLAFKIGLQIRQMIQLSRRESIELALSFAADHIRPVVSKLDPSIVNRCYRELQIAERYAAEFLRDFMLRDDGNRQELASSIAHSLVWEYPAHEFAIGPKEARRLGLKILDHCDYPDWDLAWAIFDNLRETERKILRLFPAMEAQSLLKSLSSPGGSASL